MQMEMERKLEYQYLLPDKIDFKTKTVTRDEKRKFHRAGAGLNNITHISLVAQ